MDNIAPRHLAGHYTISKLLWGDGAANDHVRNDPSMKGDIHDVDFFLYLPYCVTGIFLSAEHHTTSWEEMLRKLKRASKQSMTSARLLGLCRECGQLVGLSLEPSLRQMLPSPPQSISCPPHSILHAANLPYLHCLCASCERWLWLKHQAWDSQGEPESIPCGAASPLECT